LPYETLFGSSVDVQSTSYKLNRPRRLSTRRRPTISTDFSNLNNTEGVVI